MDDGPAKVAVLERAVQLADASQNIDAGYESRMELIGAATQGHVPEISLAAYPWCLAQADQYPGRFDEFELLWTYKMVARDAVDYPHIQRSQLNEIVNDLSTCFQQYGCTLHPVYLLKGDIAMALRDWPATKAAYAKHRKTKRSDFSECPDCEINTRVDYLATIGKWKVAIRESAPYFASNIKCDISTRMIYGTLLLPLVKSGDFSTAAEYNQRGIQRIGRRHGFYTSVAEHVWFLTIIDSLQAGVRLLNKFLVAVVLNSDPNSQFNFYRSASFLCCQLAEAGKPARLRWPTDFDGITAEKRADAATARDWFLDEAKKLAAAFDARNGNDGYARDLAEIEEWKKMVTPYPFAAS